MNERKYVHIGPRRNRSIIHGGSSVQFRWRKFPDVVAIDVAVFARFDIQRVWKKKDIVYCCFESTCWSTHSLRLGTWMFISTSRLFAHLSASRVISLNSAYDNSAPELFRRNLGITRPFLCLEKRRVCINSATTVFGDEVTLQHDLWYTDGRH